jgi:uncharacterized membrane protein
MTTVAVNAKIGGESSAGTAIHAEEFWYSTHSAVAFAAFLLILVQTISLLIPPFQSPDEPAHLKRAYLMSKGRVFLGSKDGTTGGYIDTGLLDYIHSFDDLRFQYDNKITSSTVRMSRKIEWSGKRQFSDFPNTAFYFPLSYLPQAVALTIGENTGLTVRESYYLARLFSLLVTLALILAAFLLYPVPLMVLAAFVTPMSLFQLGSASLDSVTFGLCALAGALFMRGANAKFSFSAKMHVALIICLFSLVTSRIALFALTPLPVVLYATRKSRSYLISSAALISLSAAWTIYALETVKGVPPRELTTIEIIKYYLGRPASFVRVFFDTITSGSMLKSYWSMFVGVLGWLDTPLGSEIYAGFGILFAMLGILSLGRKPASVLKKGSISLACGAVCSLLLMYFVFLVTYDPHPAKIIEGIQGRYFTPIFIVFAYAIFGRRLSSSELRVGLILLSLMIAFAIVGATPRLLGRYWIV